jgi:hypothetical protein
VSGKRRLSQEQVPWVKSVQPRVGVLLGMDGESGIVAPSKAIPRLLSLCYHAGDEETAVRTLAEMSESIILYPADGPERAATLAVQPREA